MTGSMVLLAIIMTLGKILLVILRLLLVLVLLLLVLILLVLIVPIRYQMAGWVDDPKGQETLDTNALLERSSTELRFSWLLHLFRGRLYWDGAWHLSVKALFFRIPIGRRKEPEEKTEKETEQKPEQQKEPRDKEKTKELVRNLLGILRKDETKEAIRAILRGTGKGLKLLLPGKWQITGTVGLGGIENTAAMMEAEGLLLPLVCGHVWILPQMEGWRIDLKAAAKGEISVGKLVLVLVVLLLNTKVQGLIREVQRVCNYKGSGREQKPKTASEDRTAQKAA